MKRDKLATGIKRAQMSARDQAALHRLGSPGKIETGEFKRPDHNDFATSEELRERKFCGQRINGINKDWELWIHGRKVRVLPLSNYERNPEAIALAYADYFEMDADLVRIADA